MRFAYVDTSCLVAIAFGERGATALARRLERFDERFASNLVEAEFRSAFLREGIEREPELLDALSWIVPDRPLSAEIAVVLKAGYVSGADCWHLATALYLAEQPRDISFVTLDELQRSVATAIGFRT